MVHEFKHIVQEAISNQALGVKSVLATVVDLDGSSYRHPGVRMLFSSEGKITGAVSGGCVEKEVLRRAQSVFETGQSKIMTYDGRYRLGCEGVLYILLEPFEVSNEFKSSFFNALEERASISIQAFYKKEDECVGVFYSQVLFSDNKSFTFSNISEKDASLKKDIKIFKQELPPCFKLLIVGGEHDAVKLCKSAALLGWEIDVITSIKDPKQLVDFPGAKSVSSNTPEGFNADIIDSESAVVLMTHNYAQDLRYLLKLEKTNLQYIGVLGSAKRRDQLQNDLFDYNPELNEGFVNNIYSPAGLNIGAITPEEIALSILSEILATIRNKKPINLKTISGKIHAQS